MVQNHGTFRLRLNLFDGIVLVVALAVAAFIAVQMFTPKEVVVTPQTKTATYTIRLQNTVPEIVDQIEVGDALEDAIKNLALGTVVSFSSSPATESILDEGSLTYKTQEHPTYLNVDIVVTCPATIDEERIALSSGYRIRGGEAIYVRAPGYLGSGIILSIDRGIAE